jgi:hypothetical protein
MICGRIIFDMAIDKCNKCGGLTYQRRDDDLVFMGRTAMAEAESQPRRGKVQAARTDRAKLRDWRILA